MNLTLAFVRSLVAAYLIICSATPVYGQDEVNGGHDLMIDPD